MEPTIILHALATHGTWLLYPIWITSTHASLRNHNKHTQCMKKWPYSNLAQSQMLFYKHEQCIVHLYQMWTKSLHFSLRYHNKDSKFMKKMPELLKFDTELNCILCASAAHGTWSWCPIWRKSIEPSIWYLCSSMVYNPFYSNDVHGASHGNPGLLLIIKFIDILS